MALETRLASLKMKKARKNRSSFEHLDFKDPVFGDYVPDFHKTDEARSQTWIHPEIQKMIYSTLPEGRDDRFSLENEEDALMYQQNRDLAISYFKAKKQFLDDAFENQQEFLTQNNFDYKKHVQQFDAEMS